MEGFARHRMKIQQNILWRQQWKTKLGLIIELCLLPGFAHHWYPRRATKKSSKKKNVRWEASSVPSDPVPQSVG